MLIREAKGPLSALYYGGKWYRQLMIFWGIWVTGGWALRWKIDWSGWAASQTSGLRPHVAQVCGFDVLRRKRPLWWQIRQGPPLIRDHFKPTSTDWESVFIFDIANDVIWAECRPLNIGKIIYRGSTKDLRQKSSKTCIAWPTNSESLAHDTWKYD